MSLKSNSHTTAIKRNKHIARRRGNGLVSHAHRDADVIDLVAAEVDKRAAALHSQIESAAYFRAEKRGFEPGHELEDWLAAESEVAQTTEGMQS